MIFRRALLAGVLVVTLTLAMGCQSNTDNSYPIHTPTSTPTFIIEKTPIAPSYTPTVTVTPQIQLKETALPPSPTTRIITSTIEDTPQVEIAEPVAAVRKAWEGHGSLYLALCIAEKESHFNPYAVGSSGEVSIFQLHPSYVLPHFYTWGGSDPTNSWEVARFVREYTDANGWGAWKSTLVECQ